jgi:hypothetical protein
LYACADEVAGSGGDIKATGLILKRKGGKKRKKKKKGRKA